MIDDEEQMQIDLPRLSRILEQRERSWIILLILNDQLNYLYMHDFANCEKILIPYYQVKLLSFYAMQLDLLNMQDFDIFCIELAKCKSLEKLDLTKNNLGTLDDLRLKKLLDAINSCINLQNLFLGGNQFSVKQMFYVINSLRTMNIDFAIGNLQNFKTYEQFILPLITNSNLRTCNENNSSLICNPNTLFKDQHKTSTELPVIENGASSSCNVVKLKY